MKIRVCLKYSVINIVRIRLLNNMQQLVATKFGKSRRSTKRLSSPHGPIRIRLWATGWCCMVLTTASSAFWPSISLVWRMHKKVELHITFLISWIKWIHTVTLVKGMDIVPSFSSWFAKRQHLIWYSMQRGPSLITSEQIPPPPTCLAGQCCS